LVFNLLASLNLLEGSIKYSLSLGQWQNPIEAMSERVSHFGTWRGSSRTRSPADSGRPADFSQRLVFNLLASMNLLEGSIKHSLNLGQWQDP
jgi:hypothetical protein